MNKKEIAQEFTKQTLEPNQPLIDFGQVTGMIREIEQLHSKVWFNTEEFRIQQRILEAGFQGLRSRLQDLRKPIEQLEERLMASSNKLEISKVISLAALLYSHSGGNNIGANNESTVDGDCLLKRRRRKKKKKKKGVRL